ncbi:MAG: AAA family ATPase [Gammaproteobacteria bacterium]|nr:AAA family ATPase [Gammaproteobacteria bacterium]
MYADFFSLSEKPFSITPDPAYLFLSKRHEEALAHLIYGVTDSGGFIQLTGEVGTGKTTIIRSLFEQLPENVDIALILNPRLSVNEFLHSICEELKLSVGKGASNKDCFDALNPYLLDAYAQGRKVVLLVDEAQNLSVEVLEQIRLLTNLETHKDKLLQIILVGQPELEAVLKRQDMRQLAQRITARYYLTSLDKSETRAYIKHRLKVAGAKYNIFKPGAENLIYKASKGIPRLVNVIADRSLLGAFSLQQPTVNTKIAKKAIKEVLGDAFDSLNKERSNPDRARLIPNWAWSSAVVVLLGLSAWNFWPQIKQQFFDGQQVALANASTLDAPQQTSATATETDAQDTSPGSNQSAALTSTQDPVTELQASPISLSELFSEQASNTTADVAFNQLLKEWGRTPFYDHSNVCEVVKAVGLRCLYQRGTWADVLALDRPVIVELKDARQQKHQLLIKSVNKGQIVTGLPNADYAVSLSDLQSYWQGSYLVLWQPEQLHDDSLFWGTNSDSVLWLREQLSKLGMNTQPQNTNRLFTSDLAQSVKNFQASVGLDPDGIVGSRTFLALNDALDIEGRPRLVKDN